MSESAKRSITKTISWRIVASLVAFGCVWYFTGRPYLSVAVTVSAAILNTIAYYAYERFWNRLTWGRK